MTWSSTATRGRTGPRRPLREPGGFGPLAFSIPLGLSAGRPFSPLSRAISSRWAATVCSRAATLPSNSMTRAFSSVGESASRSPGGAILPGNQRSTGQESEKCAATSFAAGTSCLSKPLCTRTKTQGRQLSLHPREAHEALAAARARLTSDEERRLYRLRAGIEGTLSQGVRAFGLRQARCRGLAKMHLQTVATAVALNVDRLAAWLEHRPLAPTRKSRFLALAASHTFANGIGALLEKARLVQHQDRILVT